MHFTNFSQTFRRRRCQAPVDLNLGKHNFNKPENIKAVCEYISKIGNGQTKQIAQTAASNFFPLLIRDEYFGWKQGVYLSANRFPKTWENGI